MPRKTNAQCIIDFRKVHGDTYDYDNVLYIGAKIKVLITCKFHGDFEQRPNDHLNGHGCRKCGIIHASKKRTLSIEEYIKRCHIVHDNKYDYSSLIYDGIFSMIEVICPIHGPFQIIANDHLNGDVGCGKCAGRGLTLEERKELLTEKHNGYYGYNYMVYDGAQSIIIITCPKHGNFEQQYSMHLLGHGCDDCGYEKTAEKLMLGQEEVITRFREKFGNYFDYTKSLYDGMKEKISVCCPVHGDFDTTPFGFLGTVYGCGNCAPSKGINLELPTIHYYFQDLLTGYYKSGITTRTMKERFPELKYQRRIRLLSVEYFITGHEAKKREIEILKEFIKFRIKNKSWYNRERDSNGATEFFSIDILKRDQLLLPAP